MVLEMEEEVKRFGEDSIQVAKARGMQHPALQTIARECLMSITRIATNFAPGSYMAKP